MLQVTPELLISFETVAVRRAVELVGTVAVLGDTDTAMAGGGEAEEDVDEPPPHPNVATTTTVASTSRNLKRYLQAISDTAFRFAIVRHSWLQVFLFRFYPAVTPVVGHRLKARAHCRPTKGCPGRGRR